MEKKLNTAVVGATGLVGRTMIKVLEERLFPVKTLKLLASEKSAGQNISFYGEKIEVEKLDENSFQNVDIALFSAGSYVSEHFAPIAVKSNCIAIDNGSYWRMDTEVPLVVPEVNPKELKKHKGIIANPNCSTIQLVAALKPIYDEFGIRRIVVSTYQSISGAGQKGIDQLFSELDVKNAGNIFDNQLKDQNYKIAFNTIFHPPGGNIGFSVEETKMINETRKILGNNDLRIAVTCVRLPVLGGHGESINLELEKPFSMNDVKNKLSNAPGIVLMDDFENGIYPTVAGSANTDNVYVGRLRKDDSCENGLSMWITADNLRKGAATNAVQIAEWLANNMLL